MTAPNQPPRHSHQVISGCGLVKHMAIVGYFKSEHGMGHGHANALVGWAQARDVARR